ncbi:MAG: DUF2834 domain-containing protein [Candidatus Eiseniibacteriota bacterium]
MKLKHVYLALCVVGGILPYVPFVSFLRDHGLDFHLIFAELFSNRISTAFAFDILMSSVAFWIFVLVEGRRGGVKHLWAPLTANVIVGLSLGLPLLLYMKSSASADASPK